MDPLGLEGQINRIILPSLKTSLGFPDGSAGKESTCNAGELDSIPGLGRSLEEGNGYPLQYSCLENSIDRSYNPCSSKESGTTH